MPALKSRVINGTRYYYVNIDGKQRGLGTNFSRAKAEFSRLIGDTPRTNNEVSLGELLVLFDSWSEAHSADGTRSDYLHWLVRIAAHVGYDRPALSIAPHEIDGFVAAGGLVGTWSHVKVIVTMRRLYRWARDQGYITYDRSPMVGLRKPTPPDSPAVVFSRLQIWFLYRSNRGPFADLLRFWRHTGCRPEEPGRILSDWVSLPDRVIEIPSAHAKGRRRRRIVIPIRLVPMIRRRLALREKHLFTTTEGKPWVKAAIHSRFYKTMLRQPSLYPDGCKARIFRYTYATEKIKAGVDLMTIANLMGHVDLTMLKRHYEKVRTDLEFLRKAADA